MKLFKILLVAAVLALLPTTASAIIYVNTNAPGVHKEYDSKRGCEVWKNSMGSFIATVEESEPMSQMDKNNIVYSTKEEAEANGGGNYLVDKDFNQIKKVWDSERGCYVWKDMFGSYYGRVPNAQQLQKWTKDADFEKWYEKAKKLAKKNYIKYSDSVAKTDGQEDTDEWVIDNRYMEDDVDVDAELANADAQIDEGLNSIKEARQQLNDPEVRRAIQQYGIDVEGMLNQAEKELLGGKEKVKQGKKH